MKIELLEIISCPACQSSLQLKGSETQEEEVWSGSLHCHRCGSQFPIEAGMPHLYIDDEKWAPKAREAEGWVIQLNQNGPYDPDNDGIDLQAPYFPVEPWIRVGHSFDMALELLNLTGRELILDLGAGKGWAAKQLALHGCTVVALDIIADEKVGLGRGRAIMKNADTYFERVIGDGDNLPFLPDKFDIVFCCGALHHHSNLHLLMANIGRVLKPGGRLCAINEPCIDVLEDEQAILRKGAAEELALGINETRPNLIKYIQPLWKNDFEILAAFPGQTYGRDEEELLTWAYKLGALWRGLPFKGVRPFLIETLPFLKREMRAIYKNGLPYLKVRLNHPREKKACIHWAILLWVHTELILLARKSPETTLNLEDQVV